MSPVMLGLLVVLTACGSGSDGTASGADFTLTVAPTFVQGALPGVESALLVRVQSDADDAIDLTASVTAGQVSVDPAHVRPGKVAEITFVGPAVTTEEETVTLTITATRGSEVREDTRTIVVMPGEDLLERDARDVLGLFLPSVERDAPELGVGPSMAGDLEGRAVAPRLLVVSHYAFFDERWELGISWHIMIAPDDWAELYLRPRDELAPTRAFRLSSWSTALAGGDVEVVEVDPPAEIVR